MSMQARPSRSTECQCLPARQRVTDRPGQIALARYSGLGPLQPIPQIGEQRCTFHLSDSQAGIGWPSADHRLDRIQRGDALQCFQRQRRLGGGVHVEEFPPRVRQTCCFGHVALVQPGISRIPVRLQNAVERGEVRPWVFALTVRAVVIDHRRCGCAGKWPVIAHVAPEPPSPPPPQGHAWWCRGRDPAPGSLYRRHAPVPPPSHVLRPRRPAGAAIVRSDQPSRPTWSDPARRRRGRKSRIVDKMLRTGL